MVLPPASVVPTASSQGQGSLEYLLLIGGAILMVTVIVLVLFTSVIPSGNSILQNNLSAINQSIPGYGGVPPAYTGPLTLDWSTIPAFTNDDLNNVNTLSSIRLQNTGMQAIILQSFTPQFSFTSAQTIASPLPTMITQLTIRDGSNAIIFSSTTPISSNQGVVFPIPLVISPSEAWTISVSFDQAIYPQYVSPAYEVLHPAESEQRVALSFVENTNAVHRPGVYHSFLVYEDGFFSGTLNASIRTCNGAANPVGGTQTSVGIITDWCEQNAGSCAYQNDVGYSTRFVFPSSNVIPSASSWVDASLFMTQLSTIVTGANASHTEADPYSVLKNNPACDTSVFDSLVETNPSYPNFRESIIPLDLDEQNEVKSFHLTQTLSPGDASVNLTLVGDDYDTLTNPHPSGVYEGWRQWQTGYNTGVPTPAPFLLVRYAAPN